MKYGIVLFVLFSLFFIESADALPRYALLTGAKCGSCHINPTGGQMRNDYGITYSQNAIPLRSRDVAPQPAQVDSSGDTTQAASGGDEFMFNPKLNDYISIGGDYRGQFIYDMGSKTTTFQGMTAEFYTSIQIGKKISLYYKQDFLNPMYGNPTSYNFGGPEIYSIIKVIPSTFIKGGAFLPDYGWRVDDHTQYTRGGDLGYIPSIGIKDGMIFTPNYKDIGMEAGWWNGGLSITAGIFNGTGSSTQLTFYNQKAIVSKIEYMGSLSPVNFRIGASGYRYRDFQMGGFHGGFGMGDMVIFGEMDWTHNQLNFGPGSDPNGGPLVLQNVNSMAAFAELDYRFIQGLWGIVRYEKFDPLSGTSDNDLAPAGTNSVSRVVIGTEIFPYSFVEIRPQYRLAMETPSVDNNVALVQFHYWF